MTKSNNTPYIIQWPSVWPSLYFVLGLCILCSLGTWQMSRYFEKTRNINQCPVENIESYYCGSIYWDGFFLDFKPIAVAPRVHDGVMGYHIYALFRREVTGDTVFVNLGWSEQKNPKIFKERAARISGQFLKIHGKNMFSAQSVPEHDEWYSFDFNDLAAAFPERLAKYAWNDEAVLHAETVFYVNVEPKDGEHVLAMQKNVVKQDSYYIFDDAALSSEVLKPFVPAAYKGTHIEPSRHLQYMFFWFGMAFVMSVIFVMRFVLRSASG